MTLEKKPICVVLTGAGISAESGIPTFRAEDGLWAGHKVEEVCTPEALQKNRAKVLDFYNQRRKNAAAAKPNAAHLALVELEKAYDVRIITQNVDDLHERAGSSKVLHLHGELNKARSSFDESYIVDCFGDQKLEDKDPNGHPMRPYIVFFGINIMFSAPIIGLNRLTAVFIMEDFIIMHRNFYIAPRNTLLQKC